MEECRLHVSCSMKNWTMKMKRTITIRTILIVIAIAKSHTLWNILKTTWFSAINAKIGSTITICLPNFLTKSKIIISLSASHVSSSISQRVSWLIKFSFIRIPKITSAQTRRTLFLSNVSKQVIHRNLQSYQSLVRVWTSLKPLSLSIFW